MTIYLTKLVRIDPIKLDELGILWGTTSLGVVMSLKDWKRAEKAGAIL